MNLISSNTKWGGETRPITYQDQNSRSVPYHQGEFDFDNKAIAPTAH
jgi:hypothetical protein